MGSQGLEGCSTPIGAVSTMRGTEVMESLFSDVSSAAYVGFCFPAHPVTFWGAKARPCPPNLNHGQDTRANRTRHTTSSGLRCPRCRNENFACEEQLGHPALLRRFSGYSLGGPNLARCARVYIMCGSHDRPKPQTQSEIVTFARRGHVFFQRFRPQNQSVLVSMLVNL